MSDTPSNNQPNPSLQDQALAQIESIKTAVETQVANLSKQASEFRLETVPFYPEVSQGIATASNKTLELYKTGEEYVDQVTRDVGEQADTIKQQVVQPVVDKFREVDQYSRRNPEVLALGGGIALAYLTRRRGIVRMAKNVVVGSALGIGGLYVLSAQSDD